MYTSHGHHISGTVLDYDEKKPTAVRCGGPSRCRTCTQDAANALLKMREQQTDLSSLDIQEYIRNPVPIRAIRVTEQNIELVAKWCGGTVERLSSASASGPLPYISVPVVRPQNVRQTQAFIGDWVLYMGVSFKTYTNHSFLESFKKKSSTKGYVITNSTEVQHHQI